MLAQSRRFKRGSPKTLFFKILISAGLIFILTFLVSGNLKINQRRQTLNLKIETIKNKIQEFYQEEESLKSKISQAETEDYLKKVAREELNLQMIGERVVAFLLLKETQEGEETKSQTFWQKLLEKFKIK